MKTSTVLMAGVAAVSMMFGASAAFAQATANPADEGTNMYPGQHHGAHHATAGVKGRPLTVRPAAAPAPADPITGIANGLATPFNTVGIPLVGGAISGAGTIAAAPFGGLAGQPPSISSTPAAPLPIKARYANTGAVEATFDEGFTQDVPVDKSGPIYQIDTSGHEREVTPFSLLVFPVTAATYAVTQPLRSVAPHP